MPSSACRRSTTPASTRASSSRASAARSSRWSCSSTKVTSRTAGAGPATLRCERAHRQEAPEFGLHAVGVLELVDQDGAEAAGVALAHGGVPRQDGARLADEVVEGEDGVLALAGAERVADGRDQAGEALVLRQRAQHAVRLGEHSLEPPAPPYRGPG